MKFYKQRRIGNYIADFYCKEAGLIIELDGGQHYDEAGMESDQERTAVLESYGLTVIRFTNLDIHKNFRGVCQTIHQYVNEHKGHIKSSGNSSPTYSYPQILQRHIV